MAKKIKTEKQFSKIEKLNEDLCISGTSLVKELLDLCGREPENIISLKCVVLSVDYLARMCKNAYRNELERQMAKSVVRRKKTRLK